MPVAAAPALRAASLFDIDPELGDVLDPDTIAQARGRAVVATVDVRAGAWSADSLAQCATRPFALMLVDGLLMREQLLAGSTATELLGPGDIVALDDAAAPLVPSVIRWTAPEGATIAVLDDRVLAVMRTWPGVGRLLFERVAQRGSRLSTLRAIAQLPRVDQRLTAFFGHVAERWGRVTPDGLVVPLQLTHETLGRLIGARRPTVSLALKELAASEALHRRRDGAWLLRYGAFDNLVAAAAAAGSWHPSEAHPVSVAEPPDMSAAPPRIGKDHIVALRERIGKLRDEHDARVARCASTLARSRDARAARLAGRDRRDPFAPPPRVRRAGG